MRITSGKYRGRVIACPPGIIRPAMDRMRESMFSILGDMYHLSFLDLFSGSGLIGIEAASREAYPVHIVEMDRIKRETILKNISIVDPPITLFMSDVFKFIPNAKIPYDIVYADPPFPMKNKMSILEAVNKKQLITPDGLFIIHYPKEDKPLMLDSIGSLTLIDERTYGRSLLRFYKNKQEE
ncbi:MAG: 16S rRNA (guanine(966)-N(2))-methyltransferase RsmD [Spirochaetia bacterium]|nr:16S rRNA (guanine(966)-N(2))-methyltransferase RsmD [Spirochaetia bacterium]